MRSRCLLQLSLIFAAAVLRTQCHSVFHPAMFRSIHPSRSVRSHNPEVLDQEMVEALRSNNPSVLEVALHSLSLPNYVVLTYLTRIINIIMVKAFPKSLRNKNNKGDENVKYHKRQNIKV